MPVEMWKTSSAQTTSRTERETAPPAPMDTAASPPLDLLHLIGLGAARGYDLDLGALGLADEGAGERRGDGDAARLGVGLGLADDLPHLLLLGVLVDDRDGRAELDGFAG